VKSPFHEEKEFDQCEITNIRHFQQSRKETTRTSRRRTISLGGRSAREDEDGKIGEQVKKSDTNN
jgi:hypothetical protein